METQKDWWVEATKQCVEANLNSGSGMAIYYIMEHVKTLVAGQEAEAVRRRDAELLERVEGMQRITRDLESTHRNRALADVIKLIKK